MLCVPFFLGRRKTALQLGHFLKTCVFLNVHLSFISRQFFLTLYVMFSQFIFSFWRLLIFFEKTRQNEKTIIEVEKSSET